MKFINFTVVKISTAMAVGIVTAYFTSLSFSLLLKIFWLQYLFLAFLWLWGRAKIRSGLLFGMVTYGTFFTLGLLNYTGRQPQEQQQHFAHKFTENTSEIIQLKITGILKSNAYQEKYLATVLQMNEQHTRGQILLYISKDSIPQAYQIDDLMVASGEIQAVPGPLNPDQFDYKKYLQHQGVSHQLKLSRKQIHGVRKGTSSLIGRAESIRTHLIITLSKQPIGAQERAIMQALLLGERRDIDKDLYSQYAAAGALHILAVSGLHVGILFLILSQLLTPLESFKYGKQLKTIVLIALLWAFALLAGLSPSVVRAVTMFSFFALAGLLRRPTHSFNTLFLSFFVLLIVNPNWLFHVGFQLSYMAVFFILWVQPKIYNWYIPRFALDKSLWNICSVTIAAQLGVAPLSIYYFHQFPGLFFISNLVILPLLGFVLAGGIAVLLLSAGNLLPSWVALGYHKMISLLNDFIGWVARQDAFLFENISCSTAMLLGIYAFIISFVLFLSHRNSKRLKPLLMSLLFILSTLVWEKHQRRKEQLVLFHVTGATLLGHQHGSKLVVYESNASSFVDRYPIQSYRVGIGASKVTSELIPEVFSYQGQRILRVDSTGVYPSEAIDILLLTQNPKIHLEQLIDRLKPKMIIADGSNYPWFTKRWKETARNIPVAFHDTRTQGAFVFGDASKE